MGDMKFLGRKFKLPERPPPRHPRPSSGSAPRPLFSRAESKKPEYETYYTVKAYKYHKLKTFKGKIGRDEARLLVKQLKDKDPKSKYTIASEKVPKKRWF